MIVVFTLDHANADATKRAALYQNTPDIPRAGTDPGASVLDGAVIGAIYGGAATNTGDKIYYAVGWDHVLTANEVEQAVVGLSIRFNHELHA